MNIKWFFSLIAFMTLFAVEDDVGGSDETGNESAAEDSPTTPEEAVLTELGLNEGGAEAEDTSAGAEPAGEAAEEAAGEPEGQEGASPDQPEAKEGLNDADLAPLNSPNQKTNERFQKVTEGYKQEKARADELEQKVSQYQQSFDSLRQLGYTDENAAQDLVNFSQYRQAIYSGDAEAFSAIIADQIKQFETMYGKRVKLSASVLDDHPDLLDKVNSFDMDEETAFELARNRTLQQRATRDQQLRMQSAQQQQQVNQMLESAVTTVESMQKKWQDTDPDFPAILPHLQPHMARIGREFPPHMWPQLIDMQYQSIKNALVTTKQQSRGSDLPLRGNGHQGGRPQPSNVHEAVLQELGL